DKLSELYPPLATYIGRDEYNDRYGDLSPEGTAKAADAVAETIKQLEGLEPIDAIDEVTKADLLGELRLDQELHDAQWHLRDINVIASAAQDTRQVFDIMPTDTVQDWSVIAKRLAALPEALRGYTETLREGIARGVVPARRQVTEVATQIARYSAEDGFFTSFVAGASPSDGDLPASLANDLADGAKGAR